MSASLNARLSLMMFLNYVIWGAWYVTLDTYLTSTLKFSGTQAGAVFGTAALSCMISPFFVGLIADRFFSTERVLASLHLIGAVFLYLMTRAASFSAVYGTMLAYCICYFPPRVIGKHAESGYVCVFVGDRDARAGHSRARGIHHRAANHSGIALRPKKVAGN